MPVPPWTCTHGVADAVGGVGGPELRHLDLGGRRQRLLEPPHRLPQREAQALDVDVGVGAGGGRRPGTSRWRRRTACAPSCSPPSSRACRPSTPSCCAHSATVPRSTIQRSTSAPVSGPASTPPASTTTPSKVSWAAPSLLVTTLALDREPGRAGLDDDQDGPAVGRRRPTRRSRRRSCPPGTRRLHAVEPPAVAVGRGRHGRPQQVAVARARLSAAVRTTLPSAAGAAHRLRCSSVPNVAIGAAPSTMLAHDRHRRERAPDLLEHHACSTSP